MIKRTVLATALIFNLAVPAHAGWEFTSVTKAEGEQHSEMMNSTVKAWVDGDKSRVDFQQSGNPMMGAGNYMLSKDGGKTVFMVNPQQKTYAAWDMTNMMGMARMRHSRPTTRSKILLTTMSQSAIGLSKTSITGTAPI